MAADKDYDSVTIELAYDYNVNTAYFDGIQLYKEEFGASYTYDEDGNIKSVKDIQSQTTRYEYEDNDLTKAILPTGAELTYTYDDYHNVLTATTETGVAYTFTYDEWGNNTSVSITSGGKTITSTAAYSTDGNRLLSTTDAAGKVTTYGYDADTNVLEWVQYPEDTEATRTEYDYDNMYRLASAAVTTDTGLNLSAEYTYENDLLTAIETASTTYGFTYGDFALRSEVSIGERTLAEYTYTSRTNYLATLDYGNEDKVQYTYDIQGRVTKQTYEDGDTVTYQYDNNGALATVTDSATGIKTTYYYDFTDRLMKYVESDGTNTHSVGYEYDTINNLTALVETINGVTHETSYTYDLDNRVTSITTGDTTRTYAYDGYSRVTEQVTKHGEDTVLTTSYAYRNPTDTTTTGQIASLGIDSAGYDVTYSYTYDDNGNILSVSDGTNSTSYVYDSAGQLIRENNQAADKTWTWTYDNAGNILSRSEYEYTTESLENVTPADTVSYAYTDEDWGDLLTAYDGQTITYDEIGNPLSDGTWTYTWEHGRELASMTDGTTTWTYTYNADGLRTQRTNGTNTYKYIYNGSSLVQMTVGSDTLYFTSDTVTNNGTTYYYVKNIQGDVIAILDSAGVAVVEYSYDAWGNILSTTGELANTLGQINPLRYRSYVYDTETGLYYLQSRYYDPEVGRFLNADAYVSTGQGVLGNNMFAYCGNDPVNYIDTDGEVRIWYYLIKFCEMGYIHACVEKHIVANSLGTHTELWLLRNGKFIGRADVMRGNDVWEIKHGGSDLLTALRRILAAVTQASYYKGSQAVRTGENVVNLGDALAYSGSFTVNAFTSTYEVTYRTPAKGAILYFVTEVEHSDVADYDFKSHLIEAKKLPSLQFAPLTPDAMAATLVIVGALVIMQVAMSIAQPKQ